MKTFKVSLILRSLLPVAALAALAASAGAAELLTNGGFETGDFTGWATASEAGSNGNLFVQSGNTSPLSGFSTAGAAGGTYYALSDQNGGGAYTLLQNFTVGAGSTTNLSFSLFANDYSNAGPLNQNGPISYSAGPAQFVRVDLLVGTAGNFDTGANVLATFYANVDAGVDPNPYTAYSFDISSIVAAGGTYRLRFAEVDNQLFLNMGVDNVSVSSNAGAVPGPAAMLAFAGGLIARRRRRA